MNTKEVDYDFPVSLTPIYTELRNDKFDAVSGRQAVIREDTGETLGIVSSKYELLKHGQIIEAFRSALSDVEHNESIQLAKDGSSLFATYKLPGHTVEVKKGDLVALQFTVKNSYNGANAMQMMLGAFRLVCANGMTVGKQFFSYSQKHIGSTSGIQIGIIQEKVELLTEQFTRTLPYLQDMSRHELMITPEELFTTKRVPFPKYLLEFAKESYEKDKDYTRWGFYNGLTNAITHHMKRESPAATLGYGKLAWELAQRV